MRHTFGFVCWMHLERGFVTVVTYEVASVCFFNLHRPKPVASRKRIFHVNDCCYFKTCIEQELCLLVAIFQGVLRISGFDD